MSTAPPTFSGVNRTGQKQVNFLGSISRRVLSVVRIEDVTPRYRRIVFSADDLASGFPFRNFAPTDHVKLFFPRPDTNGLDTPILTERGWKFSDGTGDPIFRDYTVRAFHIDAASGAGELTIDFVVHDHGVAGVWARDAQLGWKLGQGGPRGNILFPEDYPHYVAAGDETALPAISRLIEEAPAGSRVTAVIEIENAAEEQPLVPATDVELDLRWVHRDSAPLGTDHASALETALRAVTIDPDERVFVFAAGEATALKPIRRYLRNELGLPKDQVNVDGYWKQGTANLDHHNNELSDDDDD